MQGNGCRAPLFLKFLYWVSWEVIIIPELLYFLGKIVLDGRVLDVLHNHYGCWRVKKFFGPAGKQATVLNCAAHVVVTELPTLPCNRSFTSDLPY
jgi:hypothetical protein